jgi:hypothetical protein
MIADEDNSWTDDIENIIKDWGEKALLTSKSYKGQSRRQKIYHYIIMIPNILSLAAISALTGVNIAINTLTISIILIVASFLSAVTLGLAELFGFRSLAKESGDVAKKYSRLYNRLASELQKNRLNRENGLVFLEYARRKYSRIQEDSPELTTSILGMIKELLSFRKKSVPDNIPVAQGTNQYASDDARIKSATVDPKTQYVIESFVSDSV